jgi:hypothetical protein
LVGLDSLSRDEHRDLIGDRILTTTRAADKLLLSQPQVSHADRTSELVQDRSVEKRIAGGAG